MGNSSSSRCLDHQQEDDGDKAGHDGSTVIHRWKIDGFSSLLLLSQTEDGFFSGTFEAKGYIWSLRMKPMTTKSDNGKCYISLSLFLCNKAPALDIATYFNLFIFDQKHGNHIKKRDECHFRKAPGMTAWHYMIPFETFKDARMGFLINDSCIFGVEILRVLYTSRMLVSDCLSLCKGTENRVLYTWKIESGANLQRRRISEAFDAGDLKWRILIRPFGGDKENKFLSITLNLDEQASCLQKLESGVYVEFSLCMKDQIEGKHKKLTKCAVFDWRIMEQGWSKFLSYEDLNNPSKGFIIDDACIIDASIAVLGSVSVDVTRV